MMNSFIQSVNIGRPQLRLRNGSDVLTGGDKQPVPSAFLYKLGFEGDGQGDSVNHGGADKAVCVYAVDHYPHWERILERPLPAGSFSENLTISNLDEHAVSIGDVFRAGAALLQVSQPRMPCAKLAAKHGEPQLVKWIADANFTGFYMRVLSEGLVARGDAFELLKSHPERISVAAVNDIIYGRSADPALIAKLAGLAEFGDSGRAIFANRLAQLTGGSQ
jgi:MOSC domain-containing protein YiiM